ncbi:ATP-sulfurylase, subunit 1 [Acinetobacter baumannii]|nr:ATP-sulfurylase, subunit 1 [Acinetobacter baumannii]SSS29034.1 ATP-sulfurylase, subunit 1 [Acinetobacter baumannii]
MVEAAVEWTAHSNPVTAEDRAARLGQKPAVIGVSAQLIEKSQALESLLIQQGVVAIAKTSLTAEQLVLLRETGVVIITTSVDGTDTEITAETVEEAVEKIVELVRL